mgnify:CR=1 FL=1
MEEIQNNSQNQPEKKGTWRNWRMSGMTPWIEKQAGRPLKTSDKVIGIILIVCFLFVFYVVLDANKYRMQVLVIEGEGKVGVNPTTELLDFGDMSRGTTAVRTVTINNGTISPMYVMIWKMGGLSELVDVSDKATGEAASAFKLKPNTEVKVDFSASMPASAEIGKEYSGRVFIFKVPTFGL